MARLNKQTTSSRLVRSDTKYNHFDEKVLVARYGPESVEAVVEIYREELPQLTAAFEQSVRHGDTREQIARRAHSLKGTLSMFAASELAAMAARIEKLPINSSAGELQSLCEEFIDGLRALEAELETLSDSLALSA